MYFEVGDRKIAIELQRSYQHLRDFVRRQERYERYGVECYWLVRDEVAKPLGKSILPQAMDRGIQPHHCLLTAFL
ncbi:hypothetical protein [Pseudomonas rhodesiae]|uniref:competence protein CoiA family protein n=1 Tax=Pseudomonas rhodesiae TaxID=76760 RepID=UPI0009F3D2F0|nr:hypothetical protein [Pseudomonas rhodesiae]